MLKSIKTRINCYASKYDTTATKKWTTTTTMTIAKNTIFGVSSKVAAQNKYNSTPSSSTAASSKGARSKNYQQTGNILTKRERQENGAKPHPSIGSRRRLWGNLAIVLKFLSEFFNFISFVCHTFRIIKGFNTRRKFQNYILQEMYQIHFFCPSLLKV